MFRTAEHDASFGRDVRFARDVCLRHINGTHHITATKGSNITAAPAVTSLAAMRQTSLYKNPRALRSGDFDYSHTIRNILNVSGAAVIIAKDAAPEDVEAAVRFIREHHQETMALYDTMVRDAEAKLAKRPL